MELEELQKHVVISTTYPDKGDNIIYPGLGLISDIGKISKLLQTLVANQNKEICADDQKSIERLVGNLFHNILLFCYEARVDIRNIEEILIRE